MHKTVPTPVLSFINVQCKGKANNLKSAVVFEIENIIYNFKIVWFIILLDTKFDTSTCVSIMFFSASRVLYK